MAEILRPNFGWKEEPLKEGLSKNGVVELIFSGKISETGNKDLDIEVHPEIIEDYIAGTKINSALVEEELVKWKKLIIEKTFTALIRIAMNSTKEDWKKEPEKYMALAIELRAWGDTSDPSAS